MNYKRSHTLVLSLLLASNVSQAGFVNFSELIQNCKTLLTSALSFKQNQTEQNASSLFRRFQTDQNLSHSLLLLSYGATDARRAEKFIEDIQKLPATERLKFLQLLPQLAPNQDLLFTILRLALRDEEQWSAFLELEKGAKRTHYRFIPQVGILSRLLTQMAQETPDLLAHFAKLIPSNYRSENTPGYVKEKYLRRVYDLILKLNFQASPFITSEILKNQPLNEKAPEQAYIKYIAWVNEYFQEPGRTSYLGEDVLAIVKLIQEWLQTLPTPLNSLQLTLFGSFPNGKADLSKSDIDLDFTVIGEKPKVPRTDLGEQLKEHQIPLETQIQDRLKSRTDKTKTTLSLIQLENELMYPGIINSIAFRITATRIEFIVYNGSHPVIYTLQNQ